jgi:predicted transcriptional regulator
LSVRQYLFLPIHPQWAVAILTGSKKWELRRRRPSITSGDVVVLYATAPLQAVVGSFLVGEVLSGSPRALWESVRAGSGSTRSSYFEIFADAPVAHAIEVTRPRRIDPYTPRFRVGQGWRFLDRGDPTHRSVIERVKRSRASDPGSRRR